jgi:hypothetical protein
MDRVTGMLYSAQNRLHAVPGYSSYQDKERRRDQDKLVRVAAADDLVKIVDALTSASAAQVAKGDLSQVSATEAVTGKVRTLADRIRTASYGFSGIFSDGAIQAGTIEQLRIFDITIQRRAAALASQAEAGVDSSDKVAAVSKATDELGSLFETRGTVIETAKPSSDRAVLNLLDTTVPPPPSPLLEVERGAAFSVLGDDYIANAVVELTDGDLRISYVRVGKNADGGAVWFVGASSPDVPTAQLVEEPADRGAAFDPATRSANATVETDKGAQSRVSAEYAVVSEGDAVNALLVLGGTRHAFTGRPVHDLDIAVYGKAGK